MSKNIFQKLYDIAKTGNKTSFLEYVKSSSILKTDPDQMLPRDIALLISSFAIAKVFDKTHWKVLEEYFQNARMTMNAQDIAVCIWSFSKTAIETKSFTWRSLANGVRSNLGSFNPKELAHICQSFAFKNDVSPALWENLKTNVLRQLYYVEANELPMMVWAFAKAGIEDAKLWSNFEKKVIVEISKMTPESQSSVIFAFAKVAKGSEDLWKLFESVIMKNIDKFQEQSLSSIVWSLDRMGRKTEQIWENLRDKLKTTENYHLYIVLNSLILRNNALKSPDEANKYAQERFNMEEKIDKMSYVDIVNLSKVLYSSRCFDNLLWDKIAFRVRQLNRDPSLVNVRLYSILAGINMSYWNLACEDHLLHFFSSVSKLEQAEKAQIRKDVMADLVEASYYCGIRKFGSYTYWRDLGKYLQTEQGDIVQYAPLTAARYCNVIARKYSDFEYFQTEVLIYEKYICQDIETFKTLLASKKALTILLQAMIMLNRPQKMLENLELIYKALGLEKEYQYDIAMFVLKQRNEGKRNPKRFNKKVVKAFGEFDQEERQRIFYALFEELFNVYLNRTYELDPLLNTFMDLLGTKGEDNGKDGEDLQEDLEDLKDIGDDSLFQPDYQKQNS